MAFRYIVVKTDVCTLFKFLTEYMWSERDESFAFHDWAGTAVWPDTWSRERGPHSVFSADLDLPVLEIACDMV